MKFCHRFYNYLYLDHYEGGIFLCPWMDPHKACIGNLNEDEIEDAYNSEYANYLRTTMDDQSFCHCRPEACPYLQNNDLEEVSPEEYERRKQKFYYPDTVNLAFDFVCNQSCETCRSSVFIPPADYAQKIGMIREKIGPCLDKANCISASGHGDPFASKYMMDVLSNMHPTNPDIKILLETNGVFFDEAHWERIKHLGDFHLEIIVTTNSFDEFTYKHISRGGNYQKLMHNLDFMSQLRKEGKISVLVSSFVIQDRNFREIPSFVKRSLENYAFDRVVLKPVYQWGTMDEEVFWFKDVLNPMHPYHEEYKEIMQDPILKTPRVYNFGGDTVHQARPYPVKELTKQFPYSMVERDSRVVIYGAGQIGRSLVEQLEQTHYYDVVLWVDKCFDNNCIKSPECICDLRQNEYDVIILATVNAAFAEEMKCRLKDMGIPEERIVSDCCRCE